MKRHEARLCMYPVDQGRRVAVAQQNFRIAANQLVVEQRENTRRTPAAARENHAYGIVGKEAVDVAGACVVLACEVAVSAVEIFTENDIEPQ